MSEPVSPSAGLRLGEALRAARQAQGLSVDEVAAQLKLKPRQIEALETGQFAELPNRLFVRGFVRNCARLLNQNAELWLSWVDEACPVSQDSHTSRVPDKPLVVLESASRWGVWLRRLMWVLVLAALGALAFWQGPAAWHQIQAHSWHWAMSPADPAPAASAPTLTPHAQPSVPLAQGQQQLVPGLPLAAPAAPPAATVVAAGLQLRMRQDAWVEIQALPHGKLDQSLRRAGTVVQLPVAQGYRLKIGNPTGVEAQWLGQALDLKAVTRKDVARLVVQPAAQPVSPLPKNNSD